MILKEGKFKIQYWLKFKHREYLFEFKDWLAKAWLWVIVASIRLRLIAESWIWWEVWYADERILKF